MRLFCFLFLLLPAGAESAALRFRITLDRGVAPHGASGRMLVFMTDSPRDRQVLGAGFIPGGTWVAAVEVPWLEPQQPLEFDPDVLAYPRAFSQAKPGGYRFMALLDPDHSYPYTGRNAGDLYGPVVKLAMVNPADAAPVDLVLDRRTEPDHPVEDTENIKRVEFQSALLTAFWGRPITMRAGIVLPPSFAASPGRRYPAVYDVHGFGGDYTAAWSYGPRLLEAMRAGRIAEMVHVYLDGSFPTGHHEFADSVNNGPWGRALTEEFIPYLERQFRLVPAPSARFLTGHSSGGWSTLWLQIRYPDFFGGTWSTAPDPVDFRSFTGFDATPGSTDNAYFDHYGRPRNLVRSHGRDIATFEQFARQEEVLGDYGGQMASFEWVFSPKGPGGRPMQLFNRVTGDLDPEVERAWEKYDIRLILQKNWETLGPQLEGKLHILCGAEDTFHLEEAVTRLCNFLASRQSDAVCEIVPGRDHMNLYQPYKTYPNGLDERIAKEMAAQYERSRNPAAQPASAKY